MSELMRIEHLSAGYGDAVVLSDMSLTVAEGETIAVLGRNGMGKTTLMATLMGAARIHGGRIWFRGAEITQLASYRRAAIGLGWVPQERDIFPFPYGGREPHGGRPSRPLDAVPCVRSLPATVRSAAQSRLPIIGRRAADARYRPRPRSQPFPPVARRASRGIGPHCRSGTLVRRGPDDRSTGMAVLLVEQHAHQILPLTDRAIVLERGRIVHQDASTALAADPELLQKWLGVTAR